MSAPVVMNIEQMQMPSEGYAQHMVVPQMMPCCFVAVPEFCEGMQFLPSAGWQPMWSPQGARRGQPDSRHGGKCKSGLEGNACPPPETAVPMQFGVGPTFWPQQCMTIQEPTAVELSNLPQILCNRKCLEASIEQAGLESEVQGLEILGRSGKAVLTLATDRAAQQCIRHFHGLRWAKSSEPVAAHYHQQPKAEETVQAPLPETPQTSSSNAAKYEKAAEDAKSLAAKPVAPTTTPKTSSFGKRTPPPSPFSSCSTVAPGSPPLMPMRPRWADLDSDDEDNFCWSESTNAENLEEAQSNPDSGNSSNTEC